MKRILRIFAPSIIALIFMLTLIASVSCDLFQGEEGPMGLMGPTGPGGLSSNFEWSGNLEFSHFESGVLTYFTNCIYDPRLTYTNIIVLNVYIRTNEEWEQDGWLFWGESPIHFEENKARLIAYACQSNPSYRTLRPHCLVRAVLYED